MSPTSAKKKSSAAGFSLVELVVSVALSAIIFAGILSGFTFLGRNLTRLVNSQEQDARSRRAFYVFSQDISGAIQISEATPSKIAVILPMNPPAGVRAGRIDSFTGSTFSSASAGWTSNLANPAAPWRVRITSGRSNGQLMKISANTATTLTFTEPDPFDPPNERPVNLSSLGLVAGMDTFELANAVTYTYVPPTPENPVAGKLTRVDAIKSFDVFTNLSSLAFTYYNQAGTPLTLATGEADLAKSGIQSVKEIELSFASAVGNSAGGTQSVFAGKSPRLVLRNRPLLQ
jgi:type II secretory pathway pseudopilin PulG